MSSLHRILVPVDFSPAATDAFRYALTLAVPLGASIEVVHAWSRVPGLTSLTEVDVAKEMAANATAQLRTLLEQTEVPPSVTVSARVVEGEAWRIISELSSFVDLVVMGTHGRTGLDRIIMGSTAERVIRMAACPVLTVRNGALTPIDLEREEERDIVRAMVDDRDTLRGVLAALIDEGISSEKINVVMSEDAHDEAFRSLDETKAKEAATSGGLIAGTVGGILGGLAGIGAVVTTGGLALFVLGPAFGMAAIGGAVGGLLGRSIPADRARILRAQIASGSQLVAVTVDDDAQAAAAYRVLKAFDAEIIEA